MFLDRIVDKAVIVAAIMVFVILGWVVLYYMPMKAMKSEIYRLNKQIEIERKNVKEMELKRNIDKVEKFEKKYGNRSIRRNEEYSIDINDSIGIHSIVIH